MSNKFDNMTLKDLAVYYNERAEKPIKKFSSRANAMTRIATVEKKAPAKKAPAKQAPAKKAPVKQTEGGGRGRQHTFGITRVIDIAENPHRESADVFKRYKLLKKGMTADSYVNAVTKKFPDQTAPRKTALADLRGFVETGNVKMM